MKRKYILLCAAFGASYPGMACDFGPFPDAPSAKDGGVDSNGGIRLVEDEPHDPGAVLEIGDSALFDRSCDATNMLPRAPVDLDRYISGSYRHRWFLSPGDHLGDDIMLPEGTPIMAAGRGQVVYYGPATGYGELLVVVEHALGSEVYFRNGNGESVLTRNVLLIYGHLRASRMRGGAPLQLVAGSCVMPGDVIGYVNDDAHNGDGAEHVHVGIRLMSAAAAWARDGRYAYRGYDSPDRRWRADFADPNVVFHSLDFQEPSDEPSEIPESGYSGPECVPEVCDGLDNDCDTIVDNGFPILRCGESACERLVQSCLEGHPQMCVPGEPEPEICNDHVDNDCNGRIDDCDAPDDPPPPPPTPPPPGCGATIEVIWPAGVPTWTFTSDFYPDGHWGSEAGSASFRRTFTCVQAGTHRLNAEFPRRVWGCGEWPEDVFTTPHGIPRVFVNGVEVSVTIFEEPGLDLGCNFISHVE